MSSRCRARMAAGWQKLLVTVTLAQRAQAMLGRRGRRAQSVALMAWAALFQQQATLQAELSAALRRVEASGIQDGISVRLDRPV